MAERSTRDEFDDPEGLFSRLVTGAGHRAGSVFENRSLMISAAVFVSVVALSGVIWASYPAQNPLAGDGAVPIIRADAQPYKFIPADRGGMAIPHQDSTIFAALKNEQPDRKVENLLAEGDEQPMDRQQLFAGLKTDLTEPGIQKTDDGIQIAGMAAENDSYRGPPMSEAERRAEVARRNRERLSQEADPLPAEVKDNSGRLPDVLKQGDISPNMAESERIEVPKEMRAPEATASDIPVNDPRIPKPVLIQKDVGVQGGSERTKPVKDWSKKPEPTRAVAVEPKPALHAPAKAGARVAKTAPAAGVASGSAFVQVASVPDQARAVGEWAKLTGSLPMLSGKAYRVQRADLGAKGTFYRLQVGPMSKDAAADLCAQIKAKKPGGCLIAK